MTIINCTPHAISIIVDGKTTTFEPSGIIPRVETIETDVESIFVCPENCQKGLYGQCGQESEHSCKRVSLPCVTQQKGEVVGLPDADEGTLLIVSGMVFAASDRKDLLAPDTGKTAIRNEKGHIVAVTRFLRK